MRADDFNEEFYNDIAKQYDKGYHPENWERKNTTEQEIGFIASNLIRDGRTLEIGAGQGRLTGTIAKLDRKSTRRNSSHTDINRMPASA